jgi:hypothetical protein
LVAAIAMAAVAAFVAAAVGMAAVAAKVVAAEVIAVAFVTRSVVDGLGRASPAATDPGDDVGGVGGRRRHLDTPPASLVFIGRRRRGPDDQLPGRLPGCRRGQEGGRGGGGGGE